MALAAGALLLVVLTVDATMNRTYTVDVHDGTGFRTIAIEPNTNGDFYAARPAVGYFGAINATANDTLRFRLTLDNGYPWSASETFQVDFNGAELARGTISAPARSTGETEFTLPAAPFFAAYPSRR